MTHKDSGGGVSGPGRLGAMVTLTSTSSGNSATLAGHDKWLKWTLDSGRHINITLEVTSIKESRPIDSTTKAGFADATRLKVSVFGKFDQLASSLGRRSKIQHLRELQCWSGVCIIS